MGAEAVRHELETLERLLAQHGESRPAQMSRAAPDGTDRKRAVGRCGRRSESDPVELIHSWPWSGVSTMASISARNDSVASERLSGCSGSPHASAFQRTGASETATRIAHTLTSESAMNRVYSERPKTS